MSSALQTLSVVCRNDAKQQSGHTPDKEVEIKNILFMLVATLKPIRLWCYLPRLPGAKNSHKITWYDDMRVCYLTWREDSVTPALQQRRTHLCRSCFVMQLHYCIIYSSGSGWRQKPVMWSQLRSLLLQKRWSAAMFRQLYSNSRPVFSKYSHLEYDMCRLPCCYQRLHLQSTSCPKDGYVYNYIPVYTAP